MLKPKPPRPDWTEMFVPTWTGDQWVVLFTNEDDARHAEALMEYDGRLELAVAQHPDDPNCWYVGVAD